ncbi:hypothetical protein IV203_025059 [Nitzschia inconspicua]|uniref:Uncharacterized protein n=1 Tax=Nitzschia inconspicua TaxID=303405 RepID=A0A9K3LNL1_9STRA|nr:hypothetical protein IV203_025193 [Nitzschia inconspicua]KAG7365618.1 hypothetical protein IV203_025059 [Nitzschia inconspicua]
MEPPDRFSIFEFLDAEYRFFSFRQTRDMSNAEYLETFQRYFEPYEQLGGNLGLGDKIIEGFVDAEDPDAITAAEWEAGKAKAREHHLGHWLIRNSDPHRYGSLRADLKNFHARGINKYPETLIQAYEMLVNYVDPNRGRNQQERSTGRRRCGGR